MGCFETMPSRWDLVCLLLLLLTLLDSSYSSVCETCVCSDTGTSRIVNCQGKRVEDVLAFDLLMFDEEAETNNLILSENEMSKLQLDVFRNLRSLKVLDLSENLIDELPSAAFNDLGFLEELDLSYNLLSTPKSSVLEKIPNLHRLNLSRNRLNDLDPEFGKTLTKLTHLDVSKNNFSILQDGSFKQLTSLEFLDISFNRIASLGVDNLVHLTRLTTLRLNNNLLVSLSDQELPSSIKQLSAGYNMITTVPKNLSNIETLDLEYNMISEIDGNELFFDKVESLNFSGNKLTDFPSVRFQRLDTLDLSNNRLSCIPDSFKTENLPELITLVVSGNPIGRLMFHSNLRLHWLIVRSLDSLESIEEDAFSNLEAASLDGCIHLIVSQNHRLSFIHEKALDNLNVCSLDLSSNNLTEISPRLVKLLDGEIANPTIDLQGNPFNCACKSQWMLRDLVPQIYAVNPQLLDNLRCGSPAELKDQRMVHWYKWQEQVFCNDSPMLLSKMTVEAAGVLSGASGTGGTINIRSSTGMLAALIGAVVALSLLVTIGIVFARRIAIKRARRNRRF